MNSWIGFLACHINRDLVCIQQNTHTTNLTTEKKYSWNCCLENDLHRFYKTMTNFSKRQFWFMKLFKPPTLKSVQGGWLNNHLNPNGYNRSKLSTRDVLAKMYLWWINYMNQFLQLIMKHETCLLHLTIMIFKNCWLCQWNLTELENLWNWL